MRKSRALVAVLALAALFAGGGCIVAVPYGHGRPYWSHHHHRY
jgi:hypothetical protein